MKWIILLVTAFSGAYAAPRDTIEQEILPKIPSTHFFPRSRIYNFLDNYTDEELEKVIADYFFLYGEIFSKAEKQPLYVCTAGGPGAGKSTILENFIEQGEVKFAYIDPDRSCLQKMSSTYLADVATGSSSEEAYTRWRGASNFISNTLMAIALNEGYAIAHGTTITSPHAGKALAAIKEYGYQRHILHISCPDVVRIASDRARQVVLFQCTEDDLINKGVWFYDRLEDYLVNSDQISFYYRPTFNQVVLAASRNGTQIEVLDENAWQALLQLSRAANSSVTIE